MAARKALQMTKDGVAASLVEGGTVKAVGFDVGDAAAAATCFVFSVSDQLGAVTSAPKRLGHPEVLDIERSAAGTAEKAPVDSVRRALAEKHVHRCVELAGVREVEQGETPPNRLGW